MHLRNFGTSDFHLCGPRFFNNVMAEFNETRDNNYIKDVVDAHCSVLKLDHLVPSGGTLNLSKNTDFGFRLSFKCGQRFLKNCRAEFNETRHNTFIEGAVEASSIS